MELDQKLLNRLAELSALQLTDEEKQNLKLHLTEILSHFEKINSVDTKEALSLSNPLNEVMRLREDKKEVFSKKEKILDEVKDKQGRLVRVPPTV